MSDKTALTHYDTACRELSAARSVDEVKGIRDKTEALRHYARQAKNRELEVSATEIRIRAERRLGQLIKDQKQSVGLNQGGRPSKTRSDEEQVSPPTLEEAGIDRKLSSRAQKTAAVPEADFERMIGEWRERSEKESERVTVNLIRTTDKAERRADRERELAEKIQALPDKLYGVIVTDCEWRFEPRSRVTGMDRAADNHYRTSVLEALKARDVASIAADSCVLFMWATAPMLPQALEVMKAWGFEYKSQYVWTKDKPGTGYWNREMHELLLIGTRGNVPAPALGTQWDSVIYAPRGRHSEKPESVLEMIESWYPNVPKIELNRRGPARAGWDAWGDEAEPAEAIGSTPQQLPPEIIRELGKGPRPPAPTRVPPYGPTFAALEMLHGLGGAVMAALTSDESPLNAKQLGAIAERFTKAANERAKRERLAKRDAEAAEEAKRKAEALRIAEDDDDKGKTLH